MMTMAQVCLESLLMGNWREIGIVYFYSGSVCLMFYLWSRYWRKMDSIFFGEFKPYEPVLYMLLCQK